MRVRLAAFEAEHGHCRVPKGWLVDPQLGRWVGSQRAYKKRLAAGHPNSKTMTERVAKLDALGFEWVLPFTNVPNEAVWEAMRAKLAAYKDEHGHCRVPAKHEADPQLGGWVGRQRKYRKRLDTGHPNPGTTKERMAKLEALGFDLGRKR